VYTLVVSLSASTITIARVDTHGQQSGAQTCPLPTDVPHLVDMLDTYMVSATPSQLCLVTRNVVDTESATISLGPDALVYGWDIAATLRRRFYLPTHIYSLVHALSEGLANSVLVHSTHEGLLQLRAVTAQGDEIVKQERILQPGLAEDMRSEAQTILESVLWENMLDTDLDVSSYGANDLEIVYLGVARLVPDPMMQEWAVPRNLEIVSAPRDSGEVFE
jgi:hypothetical protein